MTEVSSIEKDELVVKLENVNKTFIIDNQPIQINNFFSRLISGSSKKKIWALQNINLEIRKGEFFGIIGRNGSGKSTLLRIIAGTYPPDAGGKVLRKGRFMRLALGMGFDPELTAHENIFLNASILGLTLKQIREIHNDVIQFAELEEYTHTKVKFFSSGMVSRLKFAIAVHAEADIFLMDEFFGGVGDLRFKAASEKIFKESIVKGRTIIHVSHTLGTIRKHCDRVLLLDRGKQIALGSPKEVLPIYHSLMKRKK